MSRYSRRLRAAAATHRLTLPACLPGKGAHHAHGYRCYRYRSQVLEGGEREALDALEVAHIPGQEPAAAVEHDPGDEAIGHADRPAIRLQSTPVSAMIIISSS